MSCLFPRLPQPSCSWLRRCAATFAALMTLAVLAPSTDAAEPQESNPFEFNLGLQSYSLRAFDVDTALAHTQKLGVKYWEAFPNHIAIGAAPGYIQQQKDRLANANVTLMSLGVIGFDENEHKAREAFDFAHAMGLKSISADPAKTKETFDLLDRLVEEYQVAIAIHNHGPGHRYSTVSDVLEMVQDRHPLIGACVDTGHYLRSGEDPVSVIQQLGPRVHAVHLKDVRTIRSEEEKARLLKELPEGRAQQLDREGKLFTILGEGELNVVGVLRALRDVNFSGILALEYEENPSNPLSDIELSLTAAREAIAYLDDEEEGFVSIWDGKTFDNWKINEVPEAWKIEDGEIVVNGPRSHLFYTGELAPFKNFEFKAEVLAEPNSNSGIWFHTAYQPDNWPVKGLETQVNNTYKADPRKTGSLWGIIDVKEQLIPDNTWWTQHIIVQGKRVIVKIDGRTVVDYTQPDDFVSDQPPFERLVREGTFALQGHDPGSTARFKNIRVKKLPD